MLENHKYFFSYLKQQIFSYQISDTKKWKSVKNTYWPEITIKGNFNKIVTYNQ